jgi:hypothetical protein
MNQYCEVVPSSTGGHASAPGTPALSGQLPASAVSALGASPSVGGTSARSPGAGAAAHGSGAAAAPKSASGAAHGSSAGTRIKSGLLSLPAPGSRVRIAGTAIPHVSNWSLVWGLIVALVVATGAAGALAAVARRRRAGE